MKILNIQKKEGTIGITRFNFKTKEVICNYFQFTLMDPWWIPKKDDNFMGLNIVLYGWLFFYFGYSIYGAAFEDKDGKIKYKNKNYKLYQFDKNISLDIHNKIKKGYTMKMINGNVHFKERG